MTIDCPSIPPETLLALRRCLNTQEHPLSPLVPKTAALSLVDLRRLIRPETADDVFMPLLAADEARIWTALAHPKRKREWLGGRLAGKQALCTLLNRRDVPECFPRYALLPDTHGRPRPLLPDGAEHSLRLSLSHSRDYAAALATYDDPCGIDIQHVTPRLLKVRRYFATDREVRLLKESIPDPLLGLGLLWAAKEAAKKAYLADQPSFFGAIQLHSIEPLDCRAPLWSARCTVRETTRALVRLTTFSDHCLACITESSHA
ncbi:MAG: 4'-phosphopantetheinyl transferase family protein [Desulfobulbus sp.]|jgi:4'-phosphopantetheinyl transferase EntD